MLSRLLLLLPVLLAGSLLAGDAPARKGTAGEIDALIAREVKLGTRLVDDETFLRRASLDLIGRPATPEEREAFLKDSASERRAKLVDRLIASPDFGKHLANYWTNTIAAQVPPPELTFLNYSYLRDWLTEQFNQGTGWDAIVTEMLTATGTVKDRPATTFVGYHQGRPAKLAAETARLFLGLQVQCAECHDHKFDHWKRTDFHGLAAFFARSTGKLAALDGMGTTVADAGKSEWVMPNIAEPKKKGETIHPAFLNGDKLKPDLEGAERRKQLAAYIAGAKNPWFAQAFVNRVWARLMGRGFYEPVDNMAEYVGQSLPEVHEALAGHFIASGYSPKELFRLIANTRAYQMEKTLGQEIAARGQTTHTKLDGDAVFRSLEQAIGLPNVKPAPMKATAGIRFPPPPKSTRDVLCDQFLFDPSARPDEVSRTMGQAMLLMNNEQIQKQINADPKSGTQLSKLLAAEADDRKAIEKIFQQVFGRSAGEKEVTIALTHLKQVGRRGEAYEDLLWSLVNSAEFTTRR